MRSLSYAVALVACTLVSEVAAQAVPDHSQTSRIAVGYRRTSLFGVDPFRHVTIPKWGLVISAGGSAGNNALNLKDLGALSLLDSDDEITIGDVIDVISLIPRGRGLAGATQGEGSAYLGMSFGRRFTLGFSASGRSYGAFEVDDDAVALLRDGNGARQDFSLGRSGGVVLSTAEAGVHSVIRWGPFTSIDGAQLAVGVGVRYVRPVLYVSTASTVANGGTFQVTGSSISANLGMQVLSTVELEDSDGPGDPTDNILDRLRGDVGGSASLVGDLLVRFEWPTSGFAVEGMLLNLGSGLTIRDVSRRADTLIVQSTALDDLREEFDSLDFDIRDSVDVKVSLPRLWRLQATTWANALLQLDVGVQGTFSGEVELPTQVDLVSTWRLVRHLPLRAGLVLGGNQGVGYTGGFAIESSNFLLRVSGQSLGGLFRNAKGVGGRLEFGLFF